MKERPTMRPVRKITSEEENYRAEPMDARHPNIRFIKRDPIEPEPVGTIIVKAFRVTGYDQDADGSLMARLEAIDRYGEATGWEVDFIGLHPMTGLVASAEEWAAMFPDGDRTDG
jgi:hypothetical protein